MYQNKDYSELVDTINERISGNRKTRAKLYFYLGASFSRLGLYDQAAKNLEEAIQLGCRQHEIHYELGFALYSINELERSEKAFIRSSISNYKPMISLYYVGYIAIILEQYSKAKKYLLKIVKNKSKENKIRQAAYLQLAEAILGIVEKKKRGGKTVKKYVIPILNKGIKLDPKSDIAGDIKKRKSDIERLYGLDPNFMINGRQLLAKKYHLFFSQKSSYDSNVTLDNDQQTLEITSRDSFVFNTTIFGRYRFAFKRRFLLFPEIKFTNIYYQKRDVEDIFEKDGYVIGSSVRTKFEHKLFGKIGSLIFDIEYGFMEKDRLAEHDKIFYGRSLTYVFGEKIKIFSFGDTSFKLKKKNYSGYDNGLDSSTTSFVLEQLYMFSNRHILYFFSQSDWDKVEIEENSTDLYLLMLTYIVPRVFEKYSVNIGYGITFLDTKMQKSVRGVEKTHIINGAITRMVTDNFNIGISLNYTKKTSDSVDYAYDKYVTGFELKYSF